MNRIAWYVSAAAAAVGLTVAAPAVAQDAGAKPNILVIMGDDIGYWNISAYNRGQMGYRTPNIDRLAEEGGLFTDYYGQQSCTAGRAAFITGQSPMRTGLLKVGLPAAPEGLQAEDPTIADLLKPLGYMTGQFGKNHLGEVNGARAPRTELEIIRQFPAGCRGRRPDGRRRRGSIRAVAEHSAGKDHRGGNADRTGPVPRLDQRRRSDAGRR